MEYSAICEKLASIGEPYAAGLFEEPEKGYFYRHCRALARWFRSIEPVPYGDGELLYPCGSRYDDAIGYPHAVRPQYSHAYDADLSRLEKKCREAGAEDAYLAFRDFFEISHTRSGWSHGCPNYRRIVLEGLDSYRERMDLRPSANEEEAEFREGMLLLLDSIKEYAGRCVAYLRSVGAPAQLTDALEQVPFRPARTYYEGLVSWNAVFYLDGCDNFGCLDSGLAHLYRGEDLTDVLRQMFANIDAVDRWSCTLGPEYNEITRQAIRAVRGRRRPLLELRVVPDMPDDLWEMAADNLRVGSTNPSFYNEQAIHDMLHDRFPYIPEEDLARFCGCGCTETNIEGMTRAGGVDTDLNLLRLFDGYMKEHLAEKAMFEDFFDGYCRAAEEATDAMLNGLEEAYRYNAKYVPIPMRSLLFDDCIDRAKDFQAGGARYTWTMNAESGLINVIDSMAAVRKLIYEENRFSAEDFIALLDAEDEGLFRLLNGCPCFGVDDESVDLMGAELARRIFTVYRNKKPTLEFLDGFVLTEHQFTRYDGCGACVGPTPDGRRRGQPTCDSLAALRGKAVDGPTAMLRSSARLPLNLVDGISVVNLTLSKRYCENPAVLRSLVSGYFALGGIQLQITVVSAEELRDAMAHPEKHGDLLVRVGGFTEYFNRLAPGLRQAILERNIHDLEE